ncbi:Protein mmf1, mitochondrial [Savitreella phatthalungensis]
MLRLTIRSPRLIPSLFSTRNISQHLLYQARPMSSTRAFQVVEPTAACSPAAGPYSIATKANGMVFCSGQIPADSEGKLVEGDVGECTRQVITNLENVLKAAGSSLDKIVKVNIFLADMGDFAKMNEVYAKMLPDPKPARSCVAVKTLPKNVSVEIECIALQ